MLGLDLQLTWRLAGRGRWLRAELAQRKAARKSAVAGGAASAKPDAATWSNGWAAGRMTSTLRDASNAVLRM